jgi:hypothetical protein
VVLAVSDGHGSAASPRSGVGSALAVEITTNTLWQLPEPVSGEALAAAVTDIAGRWTARVTEHLAGNPLTAAELASSGLRSDLDGLVITHRPTVLYGATLLFAVVSDVELVLGQLGDGDVVVVGDDGRAARPLPPDARLLAHATTSLSDDDAVSSVRTTIIDSAHYRLVLVSTDGLCNSYSADDGFLQFGQDVLRTADAEGIDLIRNSLPDWLAETTRDGAGDDIGVAIAVLDPPLPAGAGDGRETRPAAHSG